MMMVHSYWKSKMQLPKVLHTKLGSRIVVLLLCSLLLIQPALLPKWQAYDYLMYIPLSAALISLFALLEKQNCQLLPFNSSWAIKGGEISYSFYLIHSLVLRPMDHGLKILFHIQVAKLALYFQFILTMSALVLSLASAYWLYQTIEEPWRNKIRRRKSPF